MNPINETAKLHEQPIAVHTDDPDADLTKIHDEIDKLKDELTQILETEGPCAASIWKALEIRQREKKCWYYWIKTTEGQAYIQNVRDLADGT